MQPATLGGGGGTTTLVIGTTTITGGATTQVLYNLAGVVSSSANMTYVSGSGLTVDGLITAGTVRAGATGGTMAFSTTAGAGPTLAAGTATTAQKALNITQTWNAAVVHTALFANITNTSALATSYLLNLQGGGTDAFSVQTVANNNILQPMLTISDRFRADTYNRQTFVDSASYIGFASGVNVTGNSMDTAFYRNAAGIIEINNATAGTFRDMKLRSLYSGVGNITISGTAPAYASGGCLTGAGTVITNNNGTSYFTITLGTGCSGSQPIVLTLPAATTGWNCYARNVSNPASSVPAQSSAVSTTSVTLTNYSRTLGTAAAWTDSDVVVVGCLGG